MARYRPYSILAPQFDPLSGGIRVLYGLYGWLLARGQIVYLNARYEDPDFVAIYPEIYHGNEAGAKTVVRYILNKPGVMGTSVQAGQFRAGPTEFDPGDRIYVFSRIYDTFGVDDSRLMFLPILNLGLFKDQKKKRKNNCVFVGKGQDIPLKETLGLRRIDRGLAMDQGTLADFLNTCEIMYSFENPTAMNEIARLCGCRVVFIPEGASLKYGKKELEEKYEPGMEGIGWGVGGDSGFNSRTFRERYIGLRDDFEKKLDRFIDDTQK